MFIGLSDPKTADYLNAHIERFIALAPITFLYYIGVKAAKNFIDLAGVLQMALDAYGLYEIETGTCVPYAKWNDFVNVACKTGIACLNNVGIGMDP